MSRLLATFVPLALLTPHALGTARSWLWPVGLAGERACGPRAWRYG